MKITAKRVTFISMLLVCAALALHAPQEIRAESVLENGQLPQLAQLAVK